MSTYEQHLPASQLAAELEAIKWLQEALRWVKGLLIDPDKLPAHCYCSGLGVGACDSAAAGAHFLHSSSPGTHWYCSTSHCRL